MPHWRNLVPSEYLSATDAVFDAGDLTVTIAAISQVDLGRDGKVARKGKITFTEGCKPLAANVTNLNTIGQMYGEDFTAWPGKRITMFRTTAEYQGKTVPAIRVRCIIGGNVVAQPDVTRGPSEADLDAARALLASAKKPAKKGRK